MSSVNDHSMETKQYTSQSAEELQRALDELGQVKSQTDALLVCARAVLKYHNFEDAARIIFDCCKKLVGAQAGYLSLSGSDGAENEIVLLEAEGQPYKVDPDVSMPILGLPAEAYRSGKTVYDNDYADSKWLQYMPEEHAQLENVMFAPLKLEGKTVGLLGLANKPGGFTDNDADTASTFCEFASLALQNSRTLELLEAGEERFRSVVATANDAIISIDGKGDIIFWNNAAEVMFGYPAGYIIGSPLTTIMPERFHEAHKKGMQRFLSTGYAKIIGKTIEIVACTRDGVEFPVELSIASWKIKENVFFTGILRDITDRKRAEETIERMAAFPRENPDPVMSLDAGGKVLYYNPGARSLVAGLDGPDEDVSVLLPANIADLVAECLRTGNSRRMLEVRVGNKLMSWSLHPLQSRNEVHVYGRDITGYKPAD